MSTGWLFGDMTAAALIVCALAVLIGHTFSQRPLRWSDSDLAASEIIVRVELAIVEDELETGESWGPQMDALQWLTELRRTVERGGLPLIIKTRPDPKLRKTLRRELTTRQENTL